VRGKQGPANARSRRTRAALLAATRAIIEEEGFDALTMARVAARAGVTRRSIYLHFTSRTALVNALFEYVAETEGLTASTDPVWRAASSVAALDEWAKHLARYHPRLLALSRAVDRVRRVDPDATRHYEHVVQAQRTNCRRLATWLDHENRLAPGWTVQTATDMLWALISSDVVERLIVARHWSAQRFARHLSQLLRSTFACTPGPTAGQPQHPARRSRH
jgi:AcrR family transcriptional regulator